MAIAKLQAPVADLRGKYGGMIWGKNAAGNWVRQWTKPVDPGSMAQTGKRNWFTTIRHGWRDLSTGQKAQWDTLAASPPEVDYNSVGQVILLSGSAWHTRINMRRFQVGLAYTATAPPGLTVNPPVTFGLTSYTFDWAGRTDLFSYSNTDFAGCYAILKISVSSSLGRQTLTTGFRSVYSNTVAPVGPQDITSELAEVFGWLQVGNRLFGELYKQCTGGIRSTANTVVSDTLPEPP